MKRASRWLRMSRLLAAHLVNPSTVRETSAPISLPKRWAVSPAAATAMILLPFAL